jgi:hypothetical protein
MTTKKLPVWATVRATYRSVKEHAGELALLSRGTGTAALAAVVLSYGAVQLVLTDERRGAEFLALPAGERLAAYTSLPVLIVSIGVFIIIVRWHRMIVRDMTPGETRRWARRAALLYFARGLLLGALGAAIGIVCGLLPVTLSRGVAIPDDVRWWMTVTSIAGAVLAALLVVGRLSLILPAGAVGDYHVTMRRAWQMSRGNTWRILAGSVLASGPVIIVDVLINGILEALPSMSGSVASLLAMLTLSLVLFVLTAIVQASFLSYAYRHLAGVGDGEGS